MARSTLRSMIPELLAAAPASAEDIATTTGRNRSAVRKLLTQMHDDEEIHVAAWRRARRGPFISLFSFGSGIDAPPIEKLTNSEVCKRYRSTKHGRKVHINASRRWYRQNNGAAMRNIQRQQAKALLKFQAGGIAAIDPLMAAVMGSK